MEQLEETIRSLQLSIDAAPANDPDYSKLLDCQGALYRDKFNRTENLNYLQEAIEVTQKAIDITPEKHPSQPKRLSYLGHLLRDRYLMTDQIPDIEAAIGCVNAAAKITRDHPDHRIYLSDLGIFYGEKFQVTDEIVDIDQAIQYMKQVINTNPKHLPVPARVLNSLGSLLGDRFLRSNEVPDIDEAIEHTENAANTTSDNDRDKAKFLNDLASLFGDRFSCIGEILDLDRAIQNNQKAIQFTSEEHPNLPIRLNNLGSLLRDRFQRKGQMMDLEQAIHFTQRAADSTAQNRPERAIYLSNLASMLGDRYQRTSQVEDIECAIDCAQKAVDASREDHPDYAKRLNNLGFLLRQQSQIEIQAANPSSLQEAIRLTLRAVKATSENDPDYAGRLNNLGLLFGDEYRCTGQPSDLDQAIQYTKDAIRMTLDNHPTPDNHPDLTTYLSNLGSLFYDRYELNGLKEDLRSSTASFESALGESSGLPLTRIFAGHSAVYHVVVEENWIKVAQLLEQVLNILPEVTQPSNARDDLQYTLRQLFGLASLTGSIFLKAGRTPVQAFQALEQSRGVISSLMMDFRDDLSSLKENHPDKWSQYLEIRQQITATNVVRNSALQHISVQDYTVNDSQRQQLFKGLSDIQDDIRTYPGFERFLLPPSGKEILDLARDGPLVSFNISEVSSEAFLITMNDIRVLSLPDLKKEKLRRCIDTCASRGNLARRDASLSIGGKKQQSSVSDVSAELSTLWKVAVKPVLAELGLLSPIKPGEKLPHVWWVGGGIMALAPIHAAGDHSQGSTENTLSHVVSSFVSTLKMLQFIRNKPQTARRELKPKILVVSMPTTPDHHVSLNVAEEAAAIEKHTSSWASTKILKRPTKEEVLSELKTCTIAHYACHGVADAVEPAKSALLLGREVQEKLTLGDLDTINHDDAQIAYLSACSTAELKVQDLVDESIHLASAFQLSGFRHVIGTLWGADDGAAVAIAGKFYEELLQNNRSDNLPVAYALHNAVVNFRNMEGNCTAISKWAPFIHMGS